MKQKSATYPVWENFRSLFRKLILAVHAWARLSTGIIPRCKLINAGSQGSPVAVDAKGKLSCSKDGSASEFTIKTFGNPDAFKFYLLIDGMQKLISVCDSTEVPSLILMKDNKNLQQVFKLKEVADQSSNSVYFITCEVNGSEQCMTIGDDEKTLILSELMENDEKQKWKVLQC